MKRIGDFVNKGLEIRAAHFLKFVKEKVKAVFEFLSRLIFKES